MCSFFRDLRLKLESSKLKELFFAQVLVVDRSFITSSGANTHFLKKIILSFFRPNPDFKHFFLTFFVVQGIGFQTGFLPTEISFFLCIFREQAE